MSWKLEGTYFENCNCDWVCPCSVTSLTAPSTQDRCQVIMIYHVAAGEINGTDVGGVSVALVADTPRMMTDGNWGVGLIIDSDASQGQADQLASVFSGQLGGPMAGLVPLIGKMLGIERAPIDFADDGLRHSARIGDDITVEVEDFVPPGLPDGTPTRLAGVFHPANSTLTVAKPVTSRIHAFGMDFHNEGKSAFSAPFAWQA
ncbi:MAG TPA: DUF1326 domain-containing protein [Candidatus Micrarchaeaceae archaeon]|nr:DUF1326 domain-containing protein [Candidatus Micrarchaeaceae archaeon]